MTSEEPGVASEAKRVSGMTSEEPSVAPEAKRVSGMTSQPASPSERAVLEEVLQSIRGVQFGSVLITIHQGEVVGIETATKKRLSSNGSKP